jgi:hypothetical protein
MSFRVARQTLILLLLVALRVESTPPRPAVPRAFNPEAIRLKATASIWLADTTPEERNSSAGQFAIFKLKSIQEMAAIRFDAEPIKGREVRSARLFLHKAGKDMLRYLRVSTVNQDWVAGASSRPYGPADGATYLWADANHRLAWSYPGSEFADVVMGMGHSITTYAELRQEPGEWISVPLTPELVYALAAGNSDGLAVMDGGNLAYFNNYLDGAGAGNNAPYIEVEAGDALTAIPARPAVTAEPAPEHAHAGSGAIRITVQPDADVLCWQLKLDGQPVPRWQVPYPPAVAQTGREQDHIRSGRSPRGGPIVFYLDTLEPRQSHTLDVVAVARGGAASSPAQLTVGSSAALPDSLQIRPAVQPQGTAAPVKGGTRFAVWPAPGLIKISPDRGASMFRDMVGDGRGTAPNAVWDGQAIQLFGGRGEYVSYQLVVDRIDLTQPLTNVTIALGDLTGSAGAIGGGDIELFKNWYARNSAGQWQAAYCVPWARGRSFDIPDRQRGIGNQSNQSMYVDVYIPKHAGAGAYKGNVTVEAGGDRAVLPIELRVYDFALPDTLSFYAELNAYSVPANLVDYHRLAHQQRLVFNPWVVRPPLQGAGKDVQVQWDSYDAAVGPLLSGEAFKGNRRAGVPTPVMYLPFEDSWPTPLSRQTYNYQGHWPGKRESQQSLIDHAMTAPHIGDGLSQSYKDEILAVQKQFVEHFGRQGWNQTEMQLFYGGKNTHRLDYGSNMWWTTDEPYHWDDWLALQFFCNLWAQGRRALAADPRVWSIRADLSRPMWTGRVLDTIVDHVYWGGFTNTRSYQRAAWLSENTGLRSRAYGSVNPATESNTQTVSALLQVWSHGANGFLPWQTLGNDDSLDANDNVGGNTLLAPGTRFGVPVVGDMRLKALRDGEQIIEYLVILADRYQLPREQVGALLAKALPLSASRVTGAALDDAEAARFGTLSDWQIAGLRRALAELIVARR